MALFPHHPLGLQLVGFTGCSAPHLRLGDKTQETWHHPCREGTQHDGMAGTAALRDMGTRGLQVQGLLPPPVFLSSGAASVAPS